MKLVTLLSVASTVLVGQTMAWPVMVLREMRERGITPDEAMSALLPDYAKRAGLPPVAPFPDNFGVPKEYTFDADLQHVDLTGDHAWIAPGPDDRRGPCSGLNALANHGFISRDGVVDRNDVINGISQAMGLSRDATIFLETATSFFNGDPISGKWSIGGYSPKVATLGALQEGLLGKPAGICGLGHLRSEGDASITRGDFSQPTGPNNNCASYPQFTKELLDLARAKYPEDGHITPSILAAHQNNRKLYSISNNPNYFSPPYAGVAFTPAAHHFVFALMANKSAEHPEGYLSPENFMSWFSYTGDPQGEITYTYGHERIPAPFYKRHPATEWTMADILSGVSQQILAYPATAGVGGNTGKVNSFAGVDIGDLTGGAATGIEEFGKDPSKLGCFIGQALLSSTPTFLSNFAPIQRAVMRGVLNTKLLPTLTSTFGDCSAFSKFKDVNSYSKTYPGLTADLSDQSRAYSPNP